MAAVGFVLKPQSPEARALADDLARWLLGCGHTPVLLVEDGVTTEGATFATEATLPPVDLVCSLGGIANVSVASMIYDFQHATLLAGLAGAVMSSVFNYAVTRMITWK